MRISASSLMPDSLDYFNAQGSTEATEIIDIPTPIPSQKSLFNIMGLDTKDSVKEIDRISYKNMSYVVFIIRDDNPLINKVYNLWFKVYIEEKGYPLNERVDIEKKIYTEPQNNSIIFCIKNDNEIIGTLRFSDRRYNDLEFDYHKHIGKECKIQEINKFMFLENYRNKLLSTFLIKAGNDFVKKRLPTDYYGINSAINMLNYYKKLGFKIVSDKIIHPIINNVSYLLIADMKVFSETVEKLWTRIYSNI
ncbi:MAG: hypothetical protein Athens101410_742 [Parcubacteria group bacterium Athens1014_10]|nr:MAG: hypothetical protein Athens101410_742 [Parcubacteria group bacterium Athens1014_10]TSD04495.1 MAG: hypothetical protein Athens071412_759 [Parcubacteria group bacterium Athens0714_12]